MHAYHPSSRPNSHFARKPNMPPVSELHGCDAMAAQLTSRIVDIQASSGKAAMSLHLVRGGIISK